MGCCHSFSFLNDYFQIPHSASSGITNNRSAAMSINGDTDDTVPLTSSKKKNSSRDLLIHNEKNSSRIIPLLEERDPNSTFKSVDDGRRMSSYDIKSDSTSSIASLENGLSNTIKENEFLSNEIQNENSDLIQNQDQNTSISTNTSGTNNNQINNDHNSGINLLDNLDDLIASTEDEGGISGEMDSSIDDDT